MFSCLQILEAFLWFVLITLLNVTLIILTLSVSRLLNLLLRLVAFLLFLNPQCLASISRWITASSSWKIGRASCRERVYIAVFVSRFKCRNEPVKKLLFISPIHLNIVFFFSSRRRHTRSVSAFLLNRSSDLHADYFDFERIEALKPAIEACGISTLSQSPMLGFHKQMDNRIKLLEEILSFRMQGVEFDNGDMYVD